MPTPAAIQVRLWVVRHGETAWSRERRHTGRTDVPLTDVGRRQAAALRASLGAREWDAVLCSPLTRARETAALAAPDAAPIYDDDLVERDYGPTEGVSSAELRLTNPDWDTWRTPVAGAETIDAVGTRVDRVIARVVDAMETPPADATAASGPNAGATPRDPDEAPGRRVLIVAHGHLLRILAARWIGQPAVVGSGLALDVGSVSVLGYEHDRRVIERWNVRD